MALKNVIGIDHAVVMVKDLDKAAENWKRLGFTVSPRGTHSAQMGSGNYTIMFDPDYIELLGVLVETEHNAPARAFLAQARRRHRAHRVHRGRFRRGRRGNSRARLCAGRPDRFRTAGDDAGRQPVGGEISDLPMADRGSAGRRAHLRLPAQDAGDGLDSRIDETRQRRQAPEAGADRLRRSPPRTPPISRA